MRIALVAPPWVPVPPPAYGGTEAVVDSLARGLAAAGHDVHLFATGDSTCPVPTDHLYETAVGVRHATPLTELSHVVRAYDRLRALAPDVVHDHTVVGPMLALSRPELVVVTTNHGPFDSELGDIYRAFRGGVPIIAISESQATEAIDIPVAAVIHHGVDVERYALGDGSGGYAVFLGRVSPDKGIDAAIRVARRAGVPLRIAAKMDEPAEHEFFRSEIQPQLGPEVEFLGELGFDDKLALLREATCLLNPIAWGEPFGMVMVEALACGTPVVANGRGSVPEIVEDGVTGFVCGGEIELVAALHNVETIDRTRCRKAAETRFSAERMVADHVALYERLVERAVSGVPPA
jgi:glycosyltransferase involved in cell wall biosynthesis